MSRDQLIFGAGNSRGVEKQFKTITADGRQKTRNNSSRYFSAEPNLAEGIPPAKLLPSIQSKTKHQLTLDEVTPELAAQIVKHYILPMFDSDAKRGLKRKPNRGKS